jgi:ferric-dicitrate binding protein FerR (iron transport regulator)
VVKIGDDGDKRINFTVKRQEINWMIRRIKKRFSSAQREAFWYLYLNREFFGL